MQRMQELTAEAFGLGAKGTKYLCNFVMTHIKFLTFS